MLSDEWDEAFNRLYERTYNVLIVAGCDEAQARSIARERVETTIQNMQQEKKNEDRRT